MLPLDEKAGYALQWIARLGDARPVCAGRQLNLVFHSFTARYAGNRRR